MSIGNFEDFEQIKANLKKSELVDDLELQFNALKIRNGYITDEFLRLSELEQVQRKSEYLQLQYQFHDIAVVMITELLDQWFLEPATEVMGIEEPGAADSSEPTATATASIPPVMENEQPTKSKEMAQPNSGFASDGPSDAMDGIDEQGAASLALQNDTTGTTQWSDIVNSEQAIMTPPPPFCVYAEIMEPLFSLKKLNSASEQTLDVVLKAITSAATEAKNRGYTIEHDSAIIIACVQRSLDGESQAIWAWELADREPTLDEFVNFLMERTKRIPKAAKPKPVPSISQSVKGQEKGAGAKKSKVTCVRCGGPHHLHRCEQFRALVLRAKIETVERAKLCANCFSHLHSTKGCSFGECKRCQTKHNSLLCPKAQRK